MLVIYCQDNEVLLMKLQSSFCCHLYWKKDWRDQSTDFLDQPIDWSIDTFHDDAFPRCNLRGLLHTYSDFVLGYLHAFMLTVTEINQEQNTSFWFLGSEYKGKSL